MRRPSRLLPATVLAAAVLPVAAWVAAAEGREEAPGLPELPSVAEQVDGLYDDEGCLRTGAGPGDTDCSVRAEELDEALSHGGADETRALEGFVGSHWAGRPDGFGPRVLPATVATSAAGSFTAQGLARNEGSSVLAFVEVTARLVDPSGAELDEVTVRSPVHDVRPGEPVPFTLSSSIAAAAVDHVEWSAAGGPAGDPAPRALSWTTYWERPAGGEPVDLYLYRDTADRRPYLLFGSVAGVGDAGADRPEVVVAWLGPDGRLESFVTTAVSGPDGAPVGHLDAGTAADALVTTPADPPAAGEALVWVQGS